MYKRVQFPRMQSSSVWIVHWKRELLHVHYRELHTPPIPGLCFQRNSTFLYSLLKFAANAVLKLMSAVIAIAHVLFVSMKSLSVSIMLLEYSFGKLKYDSTTLPMSGFLGSSPVSASKFLFLLLLLIFLLSSFQCG